MTADKGRTKIKPYGSWSKGLYLHDIAYACYYGYVHCQTFADDMRRYKQEKHGLTIDHLDGDYHNHTKANLSLMTDSANVKKRFVDEKFLPPYVVTPAYVDGNYRLQLTYDGKVLETRVL